MMSFLRVTLPVLCLAGLLVSWRLDTPDWYIFEALIFLCFLLAAAAWTLGRFELRWSWTFPLLLAIAAFPLGQRLLNATINPNATYLEILRFSTYTAVFILAFSLFRRRHEIGFLHRILIVFSLLLAAEATMQRFTYNGKVFWLFSIPHPSGMMMGPFLNHDHYSSFMALVIPLALLGAFADPRRRALYSLATAAMYASVIASGSRAGSLIATAEILICLALITVRGPEHRAAWRSRRWVVSSVFLMAALVAVVGWEPLWQRFQLEDPYAGRREVALSTIEMIRQKPWTGSGIGTWTSAYPAHATFDPGLYANAAHNDWLQWASDGGIPFAALFFVLFCISLVIAWSVPWAIGIPAVFIHCMIDFPLQGHYLPAVFFLVFGAALGSVSEKRRGALR